MNDYRFTPLEKATDYILSTFFYDKNRVNDRFLRKKLTDFYFSQLIPDFFLKNHLSNHYYSYLTATRICVSTIFLILGWRYLYRKRIKDNADKPKKYKFNVFTKKYLDYERALILNEKATKAKIIF